MNAQTKEAISGEVDIWSPPTQAALPAVSAEVDSFTAMLFQAARDPNFDTAKLKMLVDMKRDADMDVQRRQFNAAMADAQAEIAVARIKADRENDQTKSMYATLDAIGRIIDPIITKHGFSISFDPGDGAPAGYTRINYIVAHRDGYERHGKGDVPTDMAGIAGKVNKTPTHAFGSTTSYGRRYLTCMIFNVKIAREDDDGNAASRKIDERNRETIAQDQIDAIRDLLRETNSDEAKFCQTIGVDSLADIFTDRFNDACRMIEQKKRRA